MALVGASTQLLLMTGTIVWYDEYAWAARYDGLLSGVFTTWGGWVDPLARLAYNLLFSTAGLAHYFPYRVMGAVANLALAAAVYCYGRRVGRPWLAVGAALLLLLLGRSSMTVLQPLNSMNALGIASLPAGLLLVERGRRSADAAALAVLLVAMGFAGPVVAPVCVGLAAWLAMERPLPLARLAVPGLPLVLFAAGRQLLPAQARHDVPYLDNLLAAPAFVAEVAAAGAGAAVGLPADKGTTVLGLLVVAACSGIPRLAPASRRRALSLVATVLASWAALALARANFGDAQSPRYVVLTVVPVLLLAFELVGGERRTARSTAGDVAVVGLLAFSLLGNVGALRTAGAFFRTQAEIERAQLAALELALDRAPPDYRPDPRMERPLVFVTAADWRRTMTELGSPAFRPEELPATSDEARQEADRILVELAGVAVEPAEPGAGTAGGGAARCTGGGGASLEVDIPVDGLPVEARDGPVEVRLRRFAGSFQAEPWQVLAPGFSGLLLPAGDASGERWRAQLRAASGSACVRGPAMPGAPS